MANTRLMKPWFFLQTIPFVHFYIPIVCAFIGKYKPSVGTRGFSLIELMVTLTVLIILTLVAAPSFTGLRSSNQLTTAINNYVHDLALARSEALKRGRGAGVCPSTDGLACAPGGDWGAGWLIFADANNNRGWDVGDTVLRFQSGTAGITITGPADVVFFDRQGSTTAGAGNYCIKNTRLIRINASGHHRIEEAAC